MESALEFQKRGIIARGGVHGKSEKRVDPIGCQDRFGVDIEECREGNHKKRDSEP